MQYSPLCFLLPRWSLRKGLCQKTWTEGDLAPQLTIYLQSSVVDQKTDSFLDPDPALFLFWIQIVKRIWIAHQFFPQKPNGRPTLPLFLSLREALSTRDIGQCHLKAKITTRGKRTKRKIWKKNDEGQKIKKKLKLKGENKCKNGQKNASVPQMGKNILGTGEVI